MIIGTLILTNFSYNKNIYYEPLNPIERYLDRSNNHVPVQIGISKQNTSSAANAFTHDTLSKHDVHVLNGT